MQLNASECSWMQLNQLNATKCNKMQLNASKSAKCRSIQLNRAQHSSIQLNIAQCSSTIFNSPDESASLGEAARRAKRAPSMQRNLLGSAGMCWDLLASFRSYSILKRASRSLSGRFWYVAYSSHIYANYWPLRFGQVGPLSVDVFPT